MTNGQRKFDTYVATGVLLNNYANIFGLIMQMRQVADHPDLLLKKHSEGGQNVIVCAICDETAEDAIRSRCKHDFCRTCVKSYLNSAEEPNCPQCHIPSRLILSSPRLSRTRPWSRSPRSSTGSRWRIGRPRPRLSFGPRAPQAALGQCLSQVDHIFTVYNHASAHRVASPPCGYHHCDA